MPTNRKRKPRRLATAAPTMICAGRLSRLSVRPTAAAGAVLTCRTSMMGRSPSVRITSPPPLREW